jgi:probable rRNA maturation factor
MITIKNAQRKVAIDKDFLQNRAQKILELLEYADFDLGILLTSNAIIRKYNRTYRNKDKPTDVLSFPAHPTLKAGKRIVVRSKDDQNLGDIIISLEYVREKAPEWNRTFEEHLTALLVHSVFHLLGYDHETDKEYKVMQQKELELLVKL